MNHVDMFYLLALNQVQFLKTTEKLLFYELAGSCKSFFSFSKEDVEKIIQRRLRVNQIDFSKYLKRAEKDFSFLSKNNSKVGIAFYYDKAYPPQLREIYDPPFLLFYRGQIPDWSRPIVGIVGTRQPTGRARSEAYKLAVELSSHNIGVVSGLARGIDTEAHEGSLCGPGPAIAVLGNGIDDFYPASNKKLGAKIIDSGGLVVSEFSPGLPPLRYHFPQRNQIISGISRAIVVIQAPLKSGALITADYALDHGRDIFVHSVGISGISGEGSGQLAASGAVKIDSIHEIFSEWGWQNLESSDYSIEEKENCFKHPGRELARQMRFELDEKYIIHNGEYVRRG